MKNKRPVESSSTVEPGIPVSPSLELTLEAEQLPVRSSPVDRRVIFISALAILVGVASALVAQVLVHLIAVITNFAFFHRLSFE